MEVDTILVKVSSRCNINCSYCYVYNMGDEGWKKMPPLILPETVAALSTALSDLVTQQRKSFATVLHGGEPLMLGGRRLANVLSSLRSALPLSHPISIQTNGTLITNEILDICSQYRVSISVSIDGNKPINDRFRIGHRGESTFKKVVSGIDLLRRHVDAHFLFAGLLCVINPMSAAPDTYRYLKRLGATSLDFLYRDGNHSSLPFGKSSAISTEYGDWLCDLLVEYLADPFPPKIRILDDLIRLQLGGWGIKEGVGANTYGIAIIDTDGSIAKNDTLKSSFDGADRFTSRWSVVHDNLSMIFSSGEFHEYHAMQRPTSTTCNSCEFLSSCGGGMPLHRWKDGNAYDNPSVYCSDQKKVISMVRERLKQEGLCH